MNRFAAPAAVPAGSIAVPDSQAASRARPWQHLQMMSAQQVAARRVDPSSAYGAEPYYGLNGPVNMRQVDRDPDMHRPGFPGRRDI